MLEIINLKLSDIKPYEKNAKKHPKEQVEQIKNSIQEFGMNDPIAIDENNVVIEGHGRLIALKQLKAKEAPCIRLSHLTEEQKRAYILAHNKLTLNTGFDEELLKSELSFLQESCFKVELTGFDAAELSDLFGDSSEVQEDDFDAEKEAENIVTPISKQGDVWLLGRHRLRCGDSTKLSDIEHLMDGKKANLIVTDPPFGVAYSGGQGTIKNDNLKGEEFYRFLFDAFSNMCRVMADDASIYVFHADTEGFTFRKSFIDAQFHLSGVCVWVKNSLVMGRSPYQWCHEPCLFGWKKNGTHKWYTDRKQTTIWNFNRPSKSPLHSTMKPIALMAYPIKNSSTENSIVLEPFAGSSSTLIACEETNRICYAQELEEKFVDVGVKRYIELIGSADGVFLVRDGQKIPYGELEKQPND